MPYPPAEVQWETNIANNARRRGPLRFEEGLVTDTDIPNEFRRGCYADTTYDAQQSGAGWGPWTKMPAETMRERAHAGSSTWIDADSLLREFVQGAHVGMGEPSYEVETNPGTIQRRLNRAVVTD